MLQNSGDLKNVDVQDQGQKPVSIRRGVIYGLLIGIFFLIVIFGITGARECGCGGGIDPSIIPLSLIILFLPAAGMGFIAWSINNRYTLSNRQSITSKLPSLDLPKPERAQWKLGNFLTLVWVVLWIIGVIALQVSPLLAILMMLVPYFLSVRLMMWVNVPLQQGDYDEAMRRLDTLKRWYAESVSLLNTEGAIHMWAGHAAESENTFRLMLARSVRSKIYQTLALNNYACELMYQGRYEEALPLLESLIELQPRYPIAYENLATWYLAQNLAPEHALELAQQGLSLPTPWWTGNKSTSRLPKMATCALAEARNGLEARARATLDEALRKSDPKIKPRFAALNSTAGETYLALNDLPAARQHFARAAETDPNGRIGKLAREKLNSLPAAD